MSVLFIHSHYGAVEPLFARAIAEGNVKPVRERDLDAGHFAAAAGLITTIHLDQIGFLLHTAALRALLDRGGRWFFNGHVLRAIVPKLESISR